MLKMPLMVIKTFLKLKGKADQFIDSLENLNPNQRNLAHQLVAQADDLDTLNDIINNQIDLNDAMKY